MNAQQKLLTSNPDKSNKSTNS